MYSPLEMVKVDMHNKVQLHRIRKHLSHQKNWIENHERCSYELHEWFMDWDWEDVPQEDPR